MADHQYISIGALNVVASPHPSGIYTQLLEEAAEVEAPVWGDDWAFITKPKRSKSDPEWLHGRVLLWTKINKKGKWLDKKKQEAVASEDKKKIDAIPDDFAPNYRSFHYVFVEHKHRLILEIRNELGEKFGSKRAEAFFSRLLSPDYRSKKTAKIDVDVTVIPEENALKTILALPRLRRLEILIKRPNPDDSSDTYKEIMKELVEQGAKSQKVELVKAPKTDSIIPNKKTKQLAEIGSTDGYVKGEGKDSSGKTIKDSTQDHPKIRTKNLGESSSLETLYAAVKLFL